MRSVRKLSCGILLIGVLGIGAGCVNNANGNGQDPYQLDFEQARKESLTDIQKSILSDGVISFDEYQEIRQRYSECLKVQGYEVTSSIMNGMVEYTVDGPGFEDPAFVAAEKTCGQTTILPIESLYYAVRDNPQNEDMNDVFAKCLVRVGVAPAGFSGKDYVEFEKKLVDAGALGEISTTETEPGSDLTNLDTPESILIPGGGDYMSDEAQNCFINPQG